MKTEERKQLGARIRTLREAQGLSQENLAETAQLHRTYVGGVERGERNVSFDNIIRIARALNVTLAVFLGGIAE